MTLTVEQVLALAPDGASASAGRAGCPSWGTIAIGARARIEAISVGV